MLEEVLTDTMTERVRIANLTEEQLDRLRALEAELGTWVVAVQPEIRLARLTMEQLGELAAAEKELGVVLLAYEHP